MAQGTILIAEDETYTRNTLAFVLENAGYQVVEVANGQEAVHRLLHLTHSAHPIDLMILDIEMAGLTGWHVLKELKRSQVAIPTIVITGLIDEQLLQKIQDDGGLEYLRKPFDPEHVTAYVSRILKKRKSLWPRLK